MVLFRNITEVALIVLGVIIGNAFCHSVEDNINELKKMIDNKDLYDNLMELQRELIKSLESDKVKFPKATSESKKYIDTSKFKIIKCNDAENGDDGVECIVPEEQTSLEDIIKYENIAKSEGMKLYKREDSSLIKRKMILIRSLKVAKVMTLGMDLYKETGDLKKALNAVDDVLYGEVGSKNKGDEVVNKNGGYLDILMHNVDKQALFDMNDGFFTTDGSFEFGDNLERIARQYRMGLFQLIGPHFPALGHLVMLSLANKNYENFFENGKSHFISWQKLLSFNMSDRFNALDLMCNVEGKYDISQKRRITYLEQNRKAVFDECNILEFLIHHFNKYQLSLISKTYNDEFKSYYLLEHKDMKEEFFRFMCGDSKNCNIYNSDIFLDNGIDDNKAVLKNVSSFNVNAPFNVKDNFDVFAHNYLDFYPNQIVYMHFYNLVGILNNEIEAYVGSLYLPGYYNAIQLAFDDDRSLEDQFKNLVKCVTKCKEYDIKNKSSNKSRKLTFKEEKIMSKCNICKGTFDIITLKSEYSLSMVEKFYNYVTKVIETQSLGNIVTNENIYDEYNNLLSNDLNWYTFLFLFRLSSYKNIHEASVSEAMYIDLKDEDKFIKTMMTDKWYPSVIKRAYTLYLRGHVAPDLVSVLEGLLKPDIIEKMKKSIEYVIHVNSFMQLDFFHALNEPPRGTYRKSALSRDLEAQFASWFYQVNSGYFFLHYDKPSVRTEYYKKPYSQRFVAPKFDELVEIFKRYIQSAYESYFKQRHVKNLIESHDTFNINNKIMLMRDSYELYLKNYKDIIFFAEPFIINKYLSLVPKLRRVGERLNFIFHYLPGNSYNFYKYGMIYGFKLNNEYLKEIGEELVSVYKANRATFTDVTFLQTLYLLCKKLEASAGSHRRNDATSITNIYMLNVSKHYSRLSKEERIKEIDDSMKSKFLAKTLYTTLHTIFSIKMNKQMNELDKQYSKPDFIRLSMDQRAYFTYAYVYYGSIVDTITNSLMPLYAKKPITQLRYGKTFIFSNYFGFMAQILGMLNLNNMKMLCEHQAITAPNNYSFDKFVQYDTKKYYSLITYFFVLRNFGFASMPLEFSYLLSESVLLRKSFFHIAMFYTLHVGSLLWLHGSRIFPKTFYGDLQEQTSDMFISEPPEKGNVHAYHQNYIFFCINMFTFYFSAYTLFRWYAHYANAYALFFMPVRFFAAYHRPGYDWFAGGLLEWVNKIAVDPFLRMVNKFLRNIKSRSEYNEIMNARINARNFKNLIEGKRSTAIGVPTMSEMVELNRSSYTMYKDDNIFFESVSEEEEFLNQRDII
ncbi:cytoadherence linked asexual protein 9, putative [Plasmodium vinckei vinckei]|uniref:Cytoadherence linked asexual protein 9, putative n=1 Tax=Plasmodium vinckei vinckei TaxID=54757 RepID=A0A449BZG9_PLAVN|nr:cytoadherence linked asexual protein 9, putative [Plasmodium vinckei vinckei]VEV58782.1 cytoadherence linked asexual protein 9, putative [Plasmodium vinckei vinckei]